ncbi:MAG: arylsulfatase [Planctomycetaceae bacterium]
MFCRKNVWLLLLATGAGGGNLSASQPHIVLVMADDMGFGDVRKLNPASKIRTPHLDGLTASGMTFRDAHTPASVCTPTRYGLLTGRYCWRSRLKRGVLNGYGRPLIEVGRPTIASFLKTQGYHTGIVGKWHLGLGFAGRQEDASGEIDFEKPVTGGPSDCGFDFSYIIPASLDFPPYVFIKDQRVTKLPTLTQPAQTFPGFVRRGARSADLIMESCLDHLLEQAVSYIERRARTERPFFLSFPLTAPHKPVLPHARFRGVTKLGPYADFVTQVDWTVGRIIEALETAHVAENTLVIYTSDNGSFMSRRDEAGFVDHVRDATVQAYRPEHHTANGPFRGTKADIWEAGHRVPFLVRWPGVVRAGTQCDQPVCLTDVFATLAEVLNQGLPAGSGPDSFSFLPLLRERGRSTPRVPIIHHSAAGMFAIRHGKWKLVLGNGSGGREQPRGKPFSQPYQLFDLELDLSEQHNCSERYPQTVQRLEQLFQQIYTISAAD